MWSEISMNLPISEVSILACAPWTISSCNLQEFVGEEVKPFKKVRVAYQVLPVCIAYARPLLHPCTGLFGKRKSCQGCAHLCEVASLLGF